MANAREFTKIKRTMRKVFDIKRLRPGQDDVIQSVIEGKNTLAIMPTGAGKSLCYQLPALHLEGTTVIVSPLISLMKDQVDQLQKKGLAVTQINSALSTSEQQQALQAIANEQSEFIFTTPERLSDPEFTKILKHNKIDFIVIDEAHCISQWGHDFRPAFLALREAVKTLGSPPVLALTATATPEVIEDIEKQLGLNDLVVFNTGIDRPNLRYEVIHVTHEEEKQQQLLQLLEEIDGNGVIYTATVKNVKRVSQFLADAGIDVTCYHGKLSKRDRKANQEKFMDDETKAIVATNAFGMGINKADIRFVIHYEVPGTLESYYQESGRAGRDGELARCILLYDLKDKHTQQFFMGGRYPSIEHISEVYQGLQRLEADQRPVKIAQLQEVARNVARTKIRVILALLKEEKVIRENRGASFRLLKTDIRAERIERMAQHYEERNEYDRYKLEQMMQYAQSALCRWKVLFEYFSEITEQKSCGNCDNCLNPWDKRIQLPGTGGLSYS